MITCRVALCAELPLATCVCGVIYAGALEVAMDLPKWFRVCILVLVGAGVLAFIDRTVQYPTLPYTKSVVHDVIVFLFGAIIGRVLLEGHPSREEPTA